MQPSTTEKTEINYTVRLT